MAFEEIRKNIKNLEPSMDFTCTQTCISKIGIGIHTSILDVALLDPERNFGSGSKNYIQVSLEWKERITCDSMGTMGKD